MMNLYEYIKSKQIQWWKRHRNRNLLGSEGERGRKAYTPKLEDNLFRPLLESVRKDYEDAAGDELTEKEGNPCKMQALHSSTALAVNIFQYWKEIDQVPLIASECKFWVVS